MSLEQNMRSETRAFARRMLDVHPELFSGRLSDLIETEADDIPSPVKTEPKPLPLEDCTAIAEVAAFVAAYHGLTLAQLRGESRRAHIVAARHQAFYICHKQLCRSLPKIGRYFNRDHTTVLHGIRKVEERGW